MKLTKRYIVEQWKDSDGYWIALKDGYKSDSDPVGALHTIVENTRREAFEHGVIRCACTQCERH